MTFDLAVTTDTNDIYFGTDGNLVLVEGDDLTAQRVRQRLMTHIGEWSLNVTIGVDYIGTVLVKNPNLNVIRAMFADVIVGTEGVDKILQLDIDTDNAARRIFVNARFAADDVVELEGEESEFGFLWSQP